MILRRRDDGQIGDVFTTADATDPDGEAVRTYWVYGEDGEAHPWLANDVEIVG